MAKTKTSSFITEIPLVVSSKQQKELLSRFQAARQLYNACLSEAMARMNLVRNSEAWEQAKQINREAGKKRSDAFPATRKSYRYSDYDMQAYATIVSNRSKWIAQLYSTKLLSVDRKVLRSLCKSE